MATRPAVLVFQEFANLTVTPTAPELNCLVAGPAYWVKDFPNDKESIKLASTYGTLNAHATGSSAAPAEGVAAVTAVAPSLKIGALVDAASARAFLGAVRVELYNATLAAAPTVGTNTVTLAVDLSAVLEKGDVVILSNAGATAKQVTTVASVVGTLVTLADDVTVASLTKLRVERDVSGYSEVDAAFISVSGNSVSVNGGIVVSGYDVTSAEVYVAYRALRTDLATVNEVNDLAELTQLVGAIDARNPLAVGASIALANTTSKVQVWGVASDDVAGYDAMQTGISSRKDIYAVVPLTSDIQVLAALKTEFEGLADPLLAQQNGVPQKFRVVIGSAGSLPLEKTIGNASSTGTSATVAGTAPAGSNELTLTSTTLDLQTMNIVPGCRVTGNLDGVSSKTYVIAHVLADNVFVIEPPAVALSATTVGATLAFTTAAGVAIDSGTADVAVAANDDLYLELQDANAAFVTSGVIAGDFVKIGTAKFEVASILSNQRLRIANNGANTSLVQNELPHGMSRTAPVTAVAALSYSVVRDLDRAGQVEVLKSVATSLKSKRAVLCWPDSVVVANLSDGSLPRSAIDSLVSAAAGAQPGYYLACAVGGLVAGLPPQHGFTNLGISGISRLNNANTYFTDKQMTDISNGGWMVFQQDTAAALPYCVHQLTTDPSTVELGELSMVKNFDFVSLFFSDILNDYIGTWNINKETMEFIRSAIQTGIENLRLRKQPRIGAPIIGATITKLAESTVSSDRLEIYVEVDFPRPLNTVALHLVSI